MRPEAILCESLLYHLEQDIRDVLSCLEPSAAYSDQRKKEFAAGLDVLRKYQAMIRERKECYEAS